MGSWLYIVLMFGAGVVVAAQTPINTALSRSTGKLEAVFLSFFTGAVVAGALVALTRRGSIAAALHAPRWHLLGGPMGVIFVSSFVLAVPRVGVARAIVAAIAGQLVTAVVIDRFGWFGVPVRLLTPQRIAGVVLLLVAVWLLQGAPEPRP